MSMPVQNVGVPGTSGSRNIAPVRPHGGLTGVVEEAMPRSRRVADLERRA
jgi:hypothetical protein